MEQILIAFAVVFAFLLLYVLVFALGLVPLTGWAGDYKSSLVIVLIAGLIGAVLAAFGILRGAGLALIGGLALAAADRKVRRKT